MSHRQDKRRHRRVAARAPATLESEGAAPTRGLVVDMSLSGAFIETSELVEAGTVCVLVLEPGGGRSPVRLPARVVHSYGGGRPNGVGVEFSDPPAAVLPAFQAWLDELHRRDRST